MLARQRSTSAASPTLLVAGAHPFLKISFPLVHCLPNLLAMSISFIFAIKSSNTLPCCAFVMGFLFSTRTSLDQRTTSMLYVETQSASGYCLPGMDPAGRCTERSWKASRRSLGIHIYDSNEFAELSSRECVRHMDRRAVAPGTWRSREAVPPRAATVMRSGLMTTSAAPFLRARSRR